MSNDTNYWAERAKRVYNDGKEYSNEIIKSMRDAYIATASDIKKEIDAFATRYATENKITLHDAQKELSRGELKDYHAELKAYYSWAKNNIKDKTRRQRYLQYLSNSEMRMRVSRLYAIDSAMRNRLSQLSAQEQLTFDKTIKDIYQKEFDKESYEIEKQTGFANRWSAGDTQAMEEIIKHKWSGANYSERIWGNKDLLLDKLNKTLLRGLAQGKNVKDIAKMMQEETSANYASCKRLAVTETFHYMNQAVEDGYEKHGIKKYKYVAGLDESTCEVCGALDGQVFNLSDAQEGINYPVMHPNCKCTTVAEIDDYTIAGATRLARDEKNKWVKMPADITYTQWRKLTGREK